MDRLNALENTPKEWSGKQYTSYEASQKQRRMERNIRAQKQKISLLELAEASEDDILAVKCRYRKAMNDYVDFSTAMGLPQQKQRLKAGDTSLNKKQRSGAVAKLSVSKAGTAVKDNHRRHVGTIPMEMVEEALDDFGNQIRNMENEYAIVIDTSGNVVEFIGGGDSVELYDVNLKHAYVLHNHPAINGILSFGADDFYFLREHQDVTMLCVNVNYNYRVKVLKNISDLSYNSLYREAMERYGVFEDYQHGVFEILKEKGYVEYARNDINKRTAGKGR